MRVDEDMKVTVLQQVRNFFVGGIHQLVCKWDACLSDCGDILMSSSPLPTRIPKQFSFGKVPHASCINIIKANIKIYGISNHEANPSLFNGCRTYCHCQTFIQSGEKQRINI